MNSRARQKLRNAGITPKAYARTFWTDGIWRGDTCGCPDDRCTGHHHNTDTNCDCIDTLISEHATANA